MDALEVLRVVGDQHCSQRQRVRSNHFVHVTDRCSRFAQRCFTAEGFGFEMCVVDPEASQLGIYERFATGLASPSALPRFTLPSYHADVLARMPKTLAAVFKLANAVRFVDRQGRELYSSRGSTVSPVKALRDLRRQPLQDSKRQRITHQWAALVQRLDRQSVPAMVREGVRSEQSRFTAFQKQGRAAPSGRPQEGRDR